MREIFRMRLVRNSMYIKMMIIAVLLVGVLTGCNDMLDKSPRDTFTDNTAFWSNTNAVEAYTNKFYDDYIGYSESGAFGWYYFKSLGDDQGNSGFDDWLFTAVPSTSTYWTNGFREVRRANYAIQNVARSSMTESQKTYYIAVARLNRAWQYYQLVREYGDVEWLSEVITDVSDEHVYGERTSRDIVMDSVCRDLDYAVDHLPVVADKTKWSKHMALAMKSDVCLYEGTFSKYRTLTDNGLAPDAVRAASYLQASADAADALITSDSYRLTPQYGEVYHSVDLGSGTETIFYRNYGKDLVMHCLIAWTSGSAEQYGITKDAFDAYLFTDGRPLASTTLDKDDRSTVNAKNNCSIARALAVRDKRLGLTIDSIVSFKDHSWARVNDEGVAEADLMTSATGYTIRKYDNLTIDKYYRTYTYTNYTDAPLYWYAVVLLNYAEAKAELGTATQTDLDRSINLLQARAGLPPLTLQPATDPANNMGVSNLLWEIRRSRRCELIADNWYRYWDLVRWHQLDKLDTSRYPNINLGANLSGIKDVSVSVNADHYIVVCNKTRKYDKKHYLFPVPTNELNLNKNIRQNPGW